MRLSCSCIRPASSSAVTSGNSARSFSANNVENSTKITQQVLRLFTVPSFSRNICVTEHKESTLDKRVFQRKNCAGRCDVRSVGTRRLPGHLACCLAHQHSAPGDKLNFRLAISCFETITCVPTRICKHPSGPNVGRTKLGPFEPLRGFPCHFSGKSCVFWCRGL